MSQPLQQIPGYTYGTSEVSRCPISSHEIDELELPAGFTTEDHPYLQLAGGDVTQV